MKLLSDTQSQTDRGGCNVGSRNRTSLPSPAFCITLHFSIYSIDSNAPTKLLFLFLSPSRPLFTGKMSPSNLIAPSETTLSTAMLSGSRKCARQKTSGNLQRKDSLRPRRTDYCRTAPPSERSITPFTPTSRAVQHTARNAET